MARPQISISLGAGGIGAAATSKDGICGLLMQSANISGGMQIDTNYKFTSLSDATDLGITAANDTSANESLYYTIKEFFRINPQGTLYFRAVNKASVTLTQMLDTANTHASSLLDYAGGDIRILGAMLNPNYSTYSPTRTDALDSDVVTAVPKAQALAEARQTLNQPIEVIVGGHGVDLTTISSVKDWRATDNEFVSVVIGAENGKEIPAVGATMGQASKIAVHESIGWVSIGNIQSDGTYVAAGFTDGNNINDHTSADWDSLHDKGYIFVLSHQGKTGFFFNSGNTSVVATSDYAYLERNRVIHKAWRTVYSSLVDYINGPLYLQTDGTLTEASRQSIMKTAEAAIDRDLTNNGNISGRLVYIDPSTNVQTTNDIPVTVELVQVATNRKMTITIGFVASLSNV